jgi:hypothetical protein
MVMASHYVCGAFGLRGTMPVVRVTRAVTVVVAIAVAACRDGSNSSSGATATHRLVPEPQDCAADSLRPATAAPAEGLWIGIQPGPGGGRVAALIGPASVKSGELKLVRRVETIEVRPTGDTLRYHADATSVHLEILPSATDPAVDSGDATRAPLPPQPTAAYAVTPLTWLAAYEPCAAGIEGPALRYLRRDPVGRIITDVMLRRASAGG